jgi:hypothetical protein
MIKTNFNLIHPELREGEMLLTNVDFDPNDIESRRQYYKFFQNLKFSSKRMGSQAYSSNGEILHYNKPIFVSIFEFENKTNSNKS